MQGENCGKESEKWEVDDLTKQLIHLIVETEPEFPADLSRIISQENGLQINEKTLTYLISHLVDYKIDKILDGSVKLDGDATKKTSKNLHLSARKVETAINIFGKTRIERPSIFTQLQTDEEAGSEDFLPKWSGSIFVG